MKRTYRLSARGQQASNRDVLPENSACITVMSAYDCAKLGVDVDVERREEPEAALRDGADLATDREGAWPAPSGCRRRTPLILEGVDNSSDALNHFCIRRPLDILTTPVLKADGAGAVGAAI